MGISTSLMPGGGGGMSAMVSSCDASAPVTTELKNRIPALAFFRSNTEPVSLSSLASIADLVILTMRFRPQCAVG